MQEYDRQRIVYLFRRRIFNILLLKNSILFAAVFLLLWGVCVLACRVMEIEGRNAYLIALSGLMFAPPMAALLSLRRLPTAKKIATILDRENAAGGLLMTSFETELGVWSEHLRQLKIPQVQWMPQQTLGFAAVAVAFAVVSLFFPVASLTASADNRLNIDDQVKRITTQLDVLKEENLLDVEEVESRKLELEKIQKDADGMGPVKTFDALDHISERLNQKAAEAIEQARRATETLAKAETLMQQVKDISTALDDSTKKSLMEGLASSLDEMFAQNQQLAEDLKKALEKKAEEEKKKDGKDGDCEGSCENGEKKGDKEDQTGKDKRDAMLESLKQMMGENNMDNLTPEMLQQFCDAMKQCQGDCERLCENLQNAGFPIDKDMLKKLAESRNIEKTEAERILSDLWANCDGCDGEPGSCEGGQRISPRYTQKQDWTTDPNAPPGDTRFEKDPDEEGAEFKAKFLPPSDLEAFRNSQKIGASIGKPDYDPNRISSQQGGAIQDANGGSGSAHSQRIYPQHRGPVGRFFEK